MERVLNQSWQWVRAWVPPGITAIALVATMIGLWLVMMNPDRSLFARESASATPAGSESAAGTGTSYRQAAASTTSQASTSATSGAAAAHAASTNECAAIRKEIDSLSVRIRATGKSKQGLRFRSRLRELRELHSDECKPGAGPAA